MSSILDALRTVKDPDLGHDVVSLEMVREGPGGVTLTVANPFAREAMKAKAEEALKAAGLSAPVTVAFAARSTRPPLGTKLLPDVRNIVAVASGKGGVGKSTVAANLAAALAAAGARVGLLDADVYGPSIPALLGLQGEKLAAVDKRIQPAEKFGMKIVSMGFLVPEGEAVIWRGPMLAGVLQQFLGDVDWGELDYMVVDLPPGTGDVQLTLCQSVPLAGAVVVSTPQDVALNVAVKAINMFEKLNTPILGVIENMSYFLCPHCGEREEVFGHGGAAEATSKRGLALLGEVPLETGVRKAGDQGAPVVQAAPESPAARALTAAAEKLAGRLVAVSR